MNDYLQFKRSNCKNCHKCIRHCPVKAISFSEGQANILPEECILCGECFVICPQTAKSIRSDLDRAKALLAESSPVWASLAPSVLANYRGATIDSIAEVMGKLGFAGVEETALGATVVKRRYDEMVRAEEHRVIISSCCHSVNTLIQKYYPAALPYLAKVVSPMLAHCADIKKRNPGAKTIFVGPCVSKKAEADEYPGAVDCVLTFEELSEWLEENRLSIRREAGEKGGKARLFPVPGGILRSMDADSETYSYMAVDGVERCIETLREISDGELENCFVEMSACRGGCVGGPAMHRHATATHIAAIDACAAREDFAVDVPPSASLVKSMPPIRLVRSRPGGRAVEEVLRKMGKTLPEHELNCGTCGYDTCRDKAAAILQGKAEITMCLPYLMERAQSFSDNVIKNTPNGIVVVNGSMEIQQINGAACRLLNIGTQNMTGRQLVCVLDPAPFLEVQTTGHNLSEQHLYLAEYDRYITLTVVRDAASHLLIGFIRDITEEEKSRNSKAEMSRRTVEITDRVIEKQMRAAQEIASLLGETTAETKVALTKLKETLRDD